MAPSSGAPLTASSTGQRLAPAFSSRTLAGQKVEFPADFRGKLVLLDFWATWCGPCRAEKPYLQAAHERFPSSRFAILGVTLDEFQRVSSARVSEFVKSEQMPWPQIYERASEIAAQYGVAGIPAAFLVDGDSGAILASGDELRGNSLAQTIAKHLESRK